MEETITSADIPALVERHHAALVWFATPYLGHEAAEDATQTAWLELLRMLRKGEPVRSVGVQQWLYAVVRNRLTDIARRELRHPSVSLDDLGGWEPVVAEWEADLGEQEAIERVLSRMTAFFREVMLMQQDGHSVFEIAARFEVQPGTMRVHLMRARRQAAALYEKESA